MSDDAWLLLQGFPIKKQQIDKDYGVHDFKKTVLFPF